MHKIDSLKHFGKFVLLFFITITSINAKSQTYNWFNEWQLGISGGGVAFYGDVSNRSPQIMNSTPFSKYFYKERTFMLNGSLQKMILPYFGVRGSLRYGKLGATSDLDKSYFSTNIFTYDLAGLVDFTNLFFGVDKRRPYSFFGVLGLGISESRTWKYDYFTKKLIDTNGFGSPKKVGGKYQPMTEGIAFAGLGFNYQLSKAFSLEFEISRFFINSDKIDATVSSTKKTEGFGMISLGIKYDLSLPKHLQTGSTPRFDNRSGEPAIKEYNKKKKVVMPSKGYNKAVKKRYKNKSN